MDKHNKKNIMFIDSMNLFFRSYCAYPSITSNGEQIGGVVGYIKTLTNLIKMFSPNIVYIAWESGGSIRRRNIYPDYKKGKKPIIFNRFYEDDLPDTTDNKLKQVAILAKLINYLPLCQVFVSDCEGDDIISFLKKKYDDDSKMIVSTDRDYYQLLDDNTKIYNPITKNVISEKEVIKEFHIPPCNFALAKSLCGDSADNIPGIKGFGYKTIAKKFPLLMSKNSILLNDLYAYASAKRDEEIHCKKLTESFDLIKRNWKLINLDAITLSAHQINKIEYMLDNFSPSLDKIKFIKLLTSEGINGLNIEDICYAFAKLNLKYGVDTKNE